ncbi:hypothetical protein [Amycolatopsis thermophila]|uniref:Uncharacterized protein n=1 Tax=Amycolatopsis thermophila TaxID=206084 RepID=A0ABU0EP09_9PSEU|nr:hypothetical protein [Amycolatopsis thermophila]MDQ0377028.1 hypothetical protein [Amycolatopsis thermophila]
MTGLLMFLLLIALIVWGLNRNHRRQAPPRMSGSFDVEDRDALRIRGEVAARRLETARPGFRSAAAPRTRHHLSRA